MFTGIVTAVGRLRRAEPAEGGVDLTIEAPFPDLVPGESVAVDGACLTVAEFGADWFRAHVVRTSLERTRFASAAAGQAVNLERALRLGDRLGGHLVQGHVDGVGTIERIAQRDDARLLDIRVPPEVAAVSVPLGSITVDGVSLTVNARPAPGMVQVSLIPFTLQHTTLGERKPGDAVHLEGDTIGKYVQALLKERG
ncbi:MAG TPA: riboflavin synthase [Gemmatimonadales bacterium]|nr:riboflavin synthase [Gemmatimonadales bacterium]